MIRIYITKDIIEMSRNYSKSLFYNRISSFVKPIKNLANLEKDLRSNGHNNYADYIKQIKRKYLILNCLEPDLFKTVHAKYFNNLTESDLKNKIVCNGKNQEFYKHVVDAMRYDAVRENEFLPYVKKLKLKTCVYCNMQFAITTTNSKGNLSGKYELDHFLPKSKYPFLCTSFFNLQPCCSNCNKSKNDNDALFSLYTKDWRELSPFEFNISRASIVKYMLSQNYEDLEIVFDSKDTLLKKDHEDKFHISELYSMQRDVAEEIIWKAKIYNDSYKQNLLESFSKLFSNSTDFNRLLLGNYDQIHHCHKRPLAKLMQDIAKQLKLIK